jgi:hypothetical protein
MSSFRASLVTTLAALAAVSVVAGACTSSSSSSPPGAAALSLRLTDAPGADVRSAVVTIDRITLTGSGGDVVLRDDPVTVDLAELVNTTFHLVDTAPVAPGTYTQLRFVIGGGYLVVADPQGATTTLYATPGYLPPQTHVDGLLKMPSLAQSGLKVTLPGDALVVQAESKVLLVDFDVQQSFGHEAGGSGSWVMHPVVRADDLLLSGNVVATLGRTAALASHDPLPLGSFTAVLTNADGSEKTLPFLPEGAGTTAAARFSYLLPGTYGVAIRPPAAPPTFDVTPASTVTTAAVSGADTFVPFVVTSIR